MKKVVKIAFYYIICALALIVFTSLLVKNAEGKALASDIYSEDIWFKERK